MCVLDRILYGFASYLHYDSKHVRQCLVIQTRGRTRPMSRNESGPHRLDEPMLRVIIATPLLLVRCSQGIIVGIDDENSQ